MKEVRFEINSNDQLDKLTQIDPSKIYLLMNSCRSLVTAHSLARLSKLISQLGQGCVGMILVAEIYYSLSLTANIFESGPMPTS